MEKIGVIILNYNTWKDTIICVDSIKNKTSMPYHIYIVDNNSTDSSNDHLCKEYAESEEVTIIQSMKNEGYSAGNNIGIKKAIQEECKIIYIINSDVVLLNDALSEMTRVLLKNSQYMMIGPSVINNENKESQLLRTKVTLKSFVFDRIPFSYIRILNKQANRIVTPTSDVFSFVGSVSGCCFGMRSEDFKQIDYLDQNVFLYGEESILAYKMEKIGKLAVFCSNARVKHKEGVSTNRKGSAFSQFHRWNSSIYILRRYGRIRKITAMLIALWNTTYWAMMSIGSIEHRKMLKSFWINNWRRATCRN